MRNKEIESCCILNAAWYKLLLLDDEELTPVRDELYRKLEKEEAGLKAAGSYEEYEEKRIDWL